ncbi:MAG: ROK family protein [Planctomycetes bacterium]|nr:ROK family protein [Planctomycetota bacterium]
MSEPGTLAIGVDGGASGVRALAVRRAADGSLEALGPRAERRHAPYAGVDLERQQAELGAGVGLDVVRCDERERERAAARARAEAAADAIAEAAHGAGARRVVLGVCWPGRKTADGRGVAVIRHGPRDPDLVGALARGLAARGLELARPLPPLASDGVAGALGEQWAARGLLRETRDALYLAGGSGLAEALLVGGRVRALDALETPLPKAFEVRCADGGNYEDALAPGGWARAARLTDATGLHAAGDAPVDWARALRVEPRVAGEVLGRAARALADYTLDRLARLRALSSFAPERAVVGARLGELLARPELSAALLDPAVAALKRAGLPSGFLRPSCFVDAPCFGAAALALGLEEAPCRN